jgi:Fe-S cluster biogenesis protein NfuA
VVSKEEVEDVLCRVRPYLQGDGGDVELVEVADNRARVRLTGNCVGCPSAHMTLYIGIETAMKDAIPDFKELLVV